MPPRIGPKRPIRVYLAQWRDYFELTQETLGQRFEPPVEKGTVSRWEASRPGMVSTGVLAAYAEALGIPVVKLYGPPPPKGQPAPPSLDALVATMPDDLREQAISVVETLAGRRRAAK